MKTLEIEVRGVIFTCTQFFDADENISGIDIKDDSGYKGEILNTEIPDDEDDEDYDYRVKLFEIEVEAYLDERYF